MMIKQQQKPYRPRHVWIESKVKTLIQCHLLNFYPDGVRLAAENLPDLDGELVLRLTRDGRVTRKCQIVSRSADVLDLQFVAKRVSRFSR